MIPLRLEPRLRRCERLGGGFIADSARFAGLHRELRGRLALCSDARSQQGTGVQVPRHARRHAVAGRLDRAAGHRTEAPPRTPLRRRRASSRARARSPTYPRRIPRPWAPSSRPPRRRRPRRPRLLTSAAPRSRARPLPAPPRRSLSRPRAPRRTAPPRRRPPIAPAEPQERRPAADDAPPSDPAAGTRTSTSASASSAPATTARSSRRPPASAARTSTSTSAC